MKKYISKNSGNHNTHMFKLLSNISDITSGCNWLITDIEAYPNDQKINEFINSNDYLFLSNIELLNMLKKEDFQWIWGVLSAIPKERNFDEVISYTLPYADGNSLIYKDEPLIQHPLAIIEIVAIDGNNVQITSKEENVINKLASVMEITK